MSLESEFYKWKATQNPSGDPQSNLVFDKAVGRDIGDVTSRDQILDPYSVVQPFDYKNNKRGRAQYESDLAQAKLRSEQQEAAYQEWYNSPSQVALREREAGKNPDLVEASGGSASDVSQSEVSPMSNIETDGQTASRVIGNVTDIVGSLSSVASLATSFSSLSLLPQQKELLGEQVNAAKIANISGAEQLFNQGISNRLSQAMKVAADAGNAFDIAGWFQNDENFAGLFESYGFEDNIVMRDTFARSREAIQKHAASAYDSATGQLKSQRSFAESLADPTYDQDVLIQMSFMQPVMEAEFKIRELQAKLQQSILDVKQEYVDNLDASQLAEGANEQAKQEAIQTYLLECQKVIEGATRDIYQNWRDGYNANKNNTRGLSYAYLIAKKGQLDWKEWLVANAVNSVFSVTGESGIVNSPPNNSKPSWNGGSGYRGIDGNHTVLFPNFIPGSFGDVF